jgi:hypothetical protein
VASLTEHMRRERDHAGRARDTVLRSISDFQAGLTDQQEVAITPTGGKPLAITAVRSSGDLVVFDGVDDENRNVQLVQSFSQVSVLLTAVDKVGSGPARRIGFLSDEG